MSRHEHMPILVINLQKDAERLRWMSQQFEVLGLSWQRIEAISSDNLDEGVVAKENARTVHRHLSVNEIACLHSHVSAWQKIVDDGLEAALLMEDDVILSKDIVRFLRDPGLLINDDCIIRFETFCTPVVLGKKQCELHGRGFYPMRSIQYGAAANVITRKQAQALLDAYARYVDTVDRMQFCDPKKHNVYQLVPALAIQLDIHEYGKRVAGQNTHLEAGRLEMERQSWRNPTTCRRRLLWKLQSVCGILLDILRGYSYRAVPFL